MRQFSTKDLTVLREPTDKNMGSGIFEFSNRYSVFHFGGMPDLIPGKGEAICRMTAVNLQLVADHGVETHFQRFIPPNRLEVDLFRVLDPKRQPIGPGERNYFVPLQVVFRNTLPLGSSVFRRLEGGSLNLGQLGLRDTPKAGEHLKQPLVEFMSKEAIDRYIDEAEARAISGLNDDQLNQLKEITLRVNEIVTRKAGGLGLEHADGKLEFAISDLGTPIVVDSVGTPDENRFLYKGFHIGKQVLRDYYAKLGFEKQVRHWVTTGVPKTSWSVPERLPSHHVRAISEMYHSLCELWTGTRIWHAPSLDEIVEALTFLGLLPATVQQ